MEKTVNILGTEYTIKEDDLNNPILDIADGVCKTFDKEIILRRQEYLGGDTEQGKQYRRAHVIRHELIHAFMEESGFNYNPSEDMVDWIAAMIPRINAVFEELIE